MARRFGSVIIGRKCGRQPGHQGPLSSCNQYIITTRLSASYRRLFSSACSRLHFRILHFHRPKMTKRQIRACLRCRQLKRRCDQAQPACTRCQQAGSPYSLDNDPVIPLATPSRESTTEVSVHLARTPSTPNHSENDMQLSSSLSACAIQETGGRKRLRKRNRACLSCSRCHRMKVRCDRKLPCARCRASGFAEDCVFTHPPTTTFNSTVQEDPVAVVTSFHSRHRGPSNWKALLFMVRFVAHLPRLGFRSDSALDSSALRPRLNTLRSRHQRSHQQGWLRTLHGSSWKLSLRKSRSGQVHIHRGRRDPPQDLRLQLGHVC